MSQPADALILAVTHLGRSKAEDLAIASLVPRVQDWDALYALAHDNRVAPCVFHELVRLGHEQAISPSARSLFAAQALKIQQDNAERLAAGLPVLQALVDAGIDVIVLKGVANGAAIYNNPAYKRMNDIDILVRKRQVRDVMDVFVNHGFIGIAERIAGDAEKQLEVTNHLPPYVNRDVSCMFGTQWSFRGPGLGHSFDMDAIWDRAVRLDLDGVGLKMLGPEDAVHHALLHLERFRTGARDVMDVHNLIHMNRDEFDWPLFHQQVQSAGTYDQVFYGLTFANAHRPIPEVAQALSRIEPRVRPKIVKMARWRSRSPEVLLRVCSRQFSTIEKAVTAFNATHALKEKFPRFVQGWGSIFVPPLSDAMKIRGYVTPRKRDMARARFVAPVRLMSAIAEEIGWHLLIGLGVKSCYDLARDALPGGSSDNLEAYAERVGLEPAQLRALFEKIQ